MTHPPRYDDMGKSMFAPQQMHMYYWNRCTYLHCMSFVLKSKSQIFRTVNMPCQTWQVIDELSTYHLPIATGCLKSFAAHIQAFQTHSIILRVCRQLVMLCMFPARGASHALQFETCLTWHWYDARTSDTS